MEIAIGVGPSCGNFILMNGKIISQQQQLIYLFYFILFLILIIAFLSNFCFSNILLNICTLEQMTN